MDLMKLVATLSLDAKNFEQGIQQAKGQVGGLSSASVAVGNLMSQGFNAAVGAVKNFAGSVLDSGKNFESTMSEVEAISGATGQELIDLSNKAQEMGAKTKFSATESAEAMTYMAMAGWKTGDMLGGIEGIMNLAAASGEDLATTSDIVTDALTAFGMTAGDAGKFADILAAASSNANTNVSMMGETFKYVAPVAGSMGYDAKDTAVAIGLLANAGIKGSQAGTTLRTVMTNLASPTGEVENAMRALGVSLTSGEGEMYSFREVMDQLRKSFGEGHLSQEEYMTRLQMIEDALGTGKLEMSEYGQKSFALSDALSNGTITLDEYDAAMADLDRQLSMGLISNTGSYEDAIKDLTVAMYGADAAQKAEYASSIAGKNAMAGLLAILGASETDWNKLTKAVDNSGQAYVKTKEGSIIPMSQAIEEGKEWIDEYAGAAEAMSAIMQNNLGGSLDSLNSRVDALRLTFYDGIKVTAREAVDGLTEAVTRATTKVGEWLSSDATQEKLSGISDKIQVLIDKLLNNLDPILDGIIGLFSGLADVITFAIDHFDQIAAIVGTVITVFTGLKVAMGALQIVNFVTSLAPLISHFMEFARVAGMCINVMMSMTTVTAPMIAGIVGIVAAIALLIRHADEVKTVLVNAFTVAWESIKAVWNTVTGFFSAIWETIKGIFAVVGAVLSGDFSGAWEAIKGIVGAWVGYFQSIWQSIQNVFSAVGNFFGSVFSLAWNLVKDVWNGVTGFFGTIVTGIKNVFNAIPDSIKGFFSKAWEGIKGIWQSVTGWFSSIVSAVINAFTSIPSRISEFFKKAWETIKGIWNAVTGWFKTLVTNVINAFTSIPSKIADFFRKAWETIKNVWNAVTGWFASVVSNVINAFTSIPQKIGGFFSNAWENVKRAFSNVTGFFGEVKEKVFGAFQNLPQRFLSIGKDIVKGLWDGINNMVGWITGKVKGFTDSVVGSFKNFFGIKSPSRVMRDEVGKYLGMGVGEGIMDEADYVQKSFDSLMPDFGSVGTVDGFGASGTIAGNSSYAITINVNGAHYNDERSLAEAISNELQYMLDRRKAVFA